MGDGQERKLTLFKKGAELGAIAEEAMAGWFGRISVS